MARKPLDAPEAVAQAMARKPLDVPEGASPPSQVPEQAPSLQIITVYAVNRVVGGGQLRTG